MWRESMDAARWRRDRAAAAPIKITTDCELDHTCTEAGELPSRENEYLATSRRGLTGARRCSGILHADRANWHRVSLCDGAVDGDVTMIEHSGGTRPNLLTRCLAITAMLTFYGLGTIGMSGLALISTTKLAEAQLMRGRGRAYGYRMIVYRGGYRGGGFVRGRGLVRGRGVVDPKSRGRRGAIASRVPVQPPAGIATRTSIQQPNLGASLQRTGGSGPSMGNRGGNWSGTSSSDGRGGGPGLSRVQDRPSGSETAGTSRSAATTASAARDERIFLCARMPDKDRAATPCCKPPYEVACR
jgi:hypothetical protein